MAAEGGLRGKGAAWRADCPRCGRSTAVTWNKRTGEAYLRSHNIPLTARQRCTLSGQLVERNQTYPGDPKGGTACSTSTP